MEKKIIVTPHRCDTINLSDVPDGTGVFGRHKHTGKLAAMIRKEDAGYITRTGMESGCSGYHKSLQECISADSKYYDFFVDL